MGLYRCREKDYSFFCDSRQSVLAHSTRKRKRSAFGISDYHSTVKHNGKMTSSLLKSSERLCSDRYSQYQASFDSAEPTLFDKSVEHSAKAATIQKRSDKEIKDIPETISTDTEHFSH